MGDVVPHLNGRTIGLTEGDGTPRNDAVGAGKVADPRNDALGDVNTSGEVVPDTLRGDDAGVNVPSLARAATRHDGSGPPDAADIVETPEVAEMPLTVVL